MLNILEYVKSELDSYKRNFDCTDLANELEVNWASKKDVKDLLVASLSIIKDDEEDRTDDIKVIEKLLKLL